MMLLPFALLTALLEVLLPSFRAFQGRVGHPIMSVPECCDGSTFLDIVGVELSLNELRHLILAVVNDHVAP